MLLIEIQTCEAFFTKILKLRSLSFDLRWALDSFGSKKISSLKWPKYKLGLNWDNYKKLEGLNSKVLLYIVPLITSDCDI